MNNVTSPKNAPSASDVARLANVSQSAVSRAFTPGASISAKTKARVMEAVKELGYHPNLLARSLLKGKTKIVGVALGNMDNEFYSLSLAALSRQFSKYGMRLLVFTATPNEQVDRQISELLHYRVDAVILMSTSLSSKLAETCVNAGISVVFYNRTANNVPDVCSVTGNNIEGAKQLAQFLLDRHYKKLAFIAGFPDSSTSNERQHAFIDHVIEQGIEQPIVKIGYYSREGAEHATRQLLSLPNPPDAIFCANDLMAIATIDIAKYEFGLTIGEDIGIVGFDDMPTSAWPSYQLTSYSQPIEKMAQKAVEFALSGESILDEEKHAVLHGELIIRNSTRTK